ncbi:sugar phosphate nucleotidyltransferase [Brevibacillus thermoruber]|uniref:Sugar phosphate nucleotidyltransferase n=1 Tax=Brevibacillus thermoruber TaxID=33942 RepID=A0A9X3TVK8_9BACL|nr:sugar phosphate nucleotidyltransferase [Brevibacillus thermoruber]MDA5110858.1 sugar phosphate nucleotidyltransferase [Brevibacillus thermoruber]
MKLVLLSGGSGKRLWPLSNDVRSKQFLRVLRNSNGKPESMVQRLWGQLRTNRLLDQVYISTSRTQVDLIQNQLGTEVPLIIEPESRDTFPAIALAAAYLRSNLGVDPGEVITVMPVDPYVEDPFFENIRRMEDVIRQSGAEIALIGVTPTYASTKYGYIVPDDHKVDQRQPQAYKKVSCFREKPSEEQAQTLLKQHALWNCGVFAFRLGYLLGELEKRGLPVEYHHLEHIYHQLPKISFDYEVVENANEVVVIPYTGLWKDLGTWNTITEEIPASVMGSPVISEDCTNTHIFNELDIPVVAIGVCNIVVAASPDGILVTDKAKSHLVKNVAKDMEQRPMFEERRWGWFHVIDFQKTTQHTEILTKRIHIHAEKNLSYQYHRNRSEVWVIAAGEGEFVLNDGLKHVRPGDVLEIPVGAKHAIKAITDLDIIEVQMGSKLEEEDIVRLSLSWEEIQQSVKNE